MEFNTSSKPNRRSLVEYFPLPLNSPPSSEGAVERTALGALGFFLSSHSKAIFTASINSLEKFSCLMRFWHSSSAEEKLSLFCKSKTSLSKKPFN